MKHEPRSLLRLADILFQVDYRPMAKIGRNQPCPCGSGVKYKKCCWNQDRLSEKPTTSSNSVSPAAAQSWGFIEEDPLCEITNHVADLIHDGQLDDAERTLEDLTSQFPDEIDPLDRKAMLLEARGLNREAASYYRRAAEYTRTHEGFESDSTDFYEQEAVRLENADPTDE